MDVCGTYCNVLSMHADAGRGRFPFRCVSELLGLLIKTVWSMDSGWHRTVVRVLRDFFADPARGGGGLSNLTLSCLRAPLRGTVYDPKGTMCLVSGAER
jgi:hypothetical protein